MCFSPDLGVWKGGEAASKGMGHNLLIQCSTLRSSKMEFPKPFFLIFWPFTISYAKHVLDPLYVFPPPYLGVWTGVGGLLKDFVTN